MSVSCRSGDRLEDRNGEGALRIVLEKGTGAAAPLVPSARWMLRWRGR